MKLCSKKILIDTIKPKKNTLHLLCRLTPDLIILIDASPKNPDNIWVFRHFNVIFQNTPSP